MVSEPDQVDPLHYLAQLQVDNYQNTGIPSTHSFSHPLLLLPTRIHHQENAWSLETQSPQFFAPRILNLSVSSYLNIVNFETSFFPITKLKLKTCWISLSLNYIKQLRPQGHLHFSHGFSIETLRTHEYDLLIVHNTQCKKQYNNERNFRCTLGLKREVVLTDF